VGERTLAGSKPATWVGVDREADAAPQRAQPPECDKIKWSPGGVTASHGVGRKPGDGKAQNQCIAPLSVTPPGLRYFFQYTGGLGLRVSHSLACYALTGRALMRSYPPASVLTPLPGLIFRSPAARQIPIYQLVYI